MWLFFYFVMFFRYAPACIECFLQVFLPILLAILSFGLLGKCCQTSQHYGHPLRGCQAMVEITMTFFMLVGILLFFFPNHPMACFAGTLVAQVVLFFKKEFLYVNLVS